MAYRNRHRLFVVFFFTLGLLSSITSGALLQGACPSNDEEWELWSRNFIADFFHSGLSPTALVSAPAELKQCADSLKPLPHARECVARAADFSYWVSLGETKSHSLGVSMTDEDYYARVPFSDMMELPPELTDPA
jgi:hypothetical protein